MNRNREFKETISVDVYKQVKRYNYSQFVKFCTELYKLGHADGVDSVPGKDMSDVINMISEVKGIGPKRLNDIQTKLNEGFDNKEV